MSFVHLHNHTDYSFLDGASKTGDLAKVAAEMGMPAVAITDHGNMCGAVDFYLGAQKAGVKPIIGCELYLTDASHKDRGADMYGKQRPIYHQLLLAKNERGWKNLVKLSSMGYLEGFYRKPRIDYDLLEQHREGIVCLSGCIQSHVNQTLLKGDEKDAMRIAGRLQDLFGEDFYIELQDHGIPEERAVFPKLIDMAKRIGAKVVATNDSHYTVREHADPHDVLLCVQTRSQVSDNNRFKFSGQEFYLKSEDEMRQVFGEVPEALTNTLEVAEKVEFEMNFEEKHYPEFDIPTDAGVRTDDDYLRQLCEEGLPRRYDEITDRIRDRMEHELGIIRQKHLSSYFLIVRDFIMFAKREKIPVGPGRGSAAGSLVSYLIEITNIDPMRYNLLFERFINPERESYPDIDVDFADSRRAEVIEYVRQKYGAECVSQIMTFGRMLSKQVVKDVGRVMGVPLPEVEAISKLIPDPVGGKPVKLKQAMEDRELKELVNSRPEYQELMNKAMVLEGTIRGAGVHAAGVIITPEPVMNYVPLYKSAESGKSADAGVVTTQFDMNHCEMLGLLKVDFLGLKTLTILEETLALIRQRGVDLELENIPIDDPETYELFAHGDTIGIFQFESSGMRENLRKLKPERLEDLIAMNALYRPGPMDNIPDYIERKHGKKFKYLHPSLAEYLDETYGIIVYQEQVMQIAHGLGGMSLGRADLLRRAMGKKKMKLMEEMKPEFMKGCEASGLNRKIAQQLWDLIEKFASYGFNKSHAAGYALVAYQTGYLKKHYPAEFMAASMTTRKNNTDELVLFLEECRRMGLQVLAPDVNSSEEDFSVPEPGKVSFGLSAIKGVGSGAISHIVGERMANGEFKTLYDLTGRMESNLVNKRVLENLIYAGATDSLPGHRAQKLEALEQAIAFGQQRKQEKSNNQVMLFGEEEEESALVEPSLPNVGEMRGLEQLAEERDRLGFYFSGHPLLRHRREVQAISTVTVNELPEGSDGQTVRIAGLLSSMEKRITKRGDAMGRGKFEDLTGTVNVIVFPKTYEKLREKLVTSEPILLTARLQLKDEQAELFLEDVEPLEEAARRLTRGVNILVRPELSGSAVLGLEEELRRHPGNAVVRVLFRTDNGDLYPMASNRYRIRPDRKLLDKAEELLGEGSVRLEMVG